MLPKLLIVGLLASGELIGTEPIREVSSQAQNLGNQPIPAFYKGYLYFIDPPARNYVRLYAPEGYDRHPGSFSRER